MDTDPRNPFAALDDGLFGERRPDANDIGPDGVLLVSHDAYVRLTRRLSQDEFGAPAAPPAELTVQLGGAWNSFHTTVLLRLGFHVDVFTDPGLADYADPELGRRSPMATLRARLAADSEPVGDDFDAVDAARNLPRYAFLLLAVAVEARGAAAVIRSYLSDDPDEHDAERADRDKARRLDGLADFALAQLRDMGFAVDDADPGRPAASFVVRSRP